MSKRADRGDNPAVKIIGVGLDLVEISRIRDVYLRHGERFISRVYTPEERKRIAVLNDPAAYLAGRWAVKEAVLKALGTGLTRGITWKDIHVVREPSGAPKVLLAGAARKRALDLGMGRILASITHSRDLAAAQALGVELEGVNDFIDKASVPGP